ncbi:MAG: SAM-dependent methyltransferase [Candidatus Curtissbacteria bacterium GW2011_GWA1_40_16]|uniref:SAM-dependent methyltransferase n=1 Tax=Candidatus Curtissbacteria bacterium GW2011_GWA1_40_16 TaxID=1618405 RepID=A0A0G0RDM5_9BACT|nr:MAG: SAM-dependent methyltransferase [Candidatus Curtissbacteria bacterium GW2011_GWA1_40_16]
METGKVARHYDTILPFYNVYFGSSYGFHIGFWEPETNSKKEAMLNVNKFLARKAGVKDGDYILDAGCGVGGSCIWLVKNYNVKTVGVTISKVQLREAKKLAKKLRLSTKIKYYRMDYLKTNFKASQFDIVWAIESVCHATNKSDFLREAKRILKKNGRLIIADFLLARNPITHVDKSILANFNEGFLLDNLASEMSFRQDLKKTGFKNIKYWDNADVVSIKTTWIYTFLKLAYSLIAIAEKFKILPESLVGTLKSTFAFHDGFQVGLLGHGVFYAEK